MSDGKYYYNGLYRNRIHPATMNNPTLRHILGVDTGVGKTRVTRLLLMAAKDRGISAFPLKPVVSGWEGDGELSGDLAEFRDYLPQGTQASSLSRYRFPLPVSPHSASKEQGERIRVSRLNDFVDQKARENDSSLLFCEGVGGVSVPLAPGLTWLDFLATQRSEALLVTTRKLGCLNHTLLSIAALKRTGIPVTAIIMNDAFAPDANDPAPATTRWELEQQTSIPVVGPLPFDDEKSGMEILSRDLPPSFWEFT